MRAWQYLTTCAATLFFPAVALSQSPPDDFSQMSLEELLDQKVTLVSRKEEKASEASSAIFVISQDDIRRSGATVIPEVLRIVPGLYVAQTDSNKWVVTARGFSDQFANKLLVMIDGRTIYTPLFSGVYWDTQNLILEDVERIEVVRGPGGTLWGANAVNGIINIITKHSQYTQGSYLSAGYGNEEHLAEGRYGGRIGDNVHYRTYARHFDKDDSVRLNGTSSNDDWYISQGGFRIDYNNSLRSDSATIQSDIYYGRKDWNYFSPSLTFPFVSTGEYVEDLTGGNLLSRWTHVLENGSESTLQAYVDTTYRDLFSLQQQVTTFDLDYQYNMDLAERHAVVWGLGYRSVWYDFNSTQLISFPSDSMSESIYSAFLQDKVSIIPEKVFITIGSKIEYNDYTGFEYQPSVRGTWLVNDKQTAWASISRAVRVPSISENSITLTNSSFPAGALGTGTPAGFVQVLGDGDVNSEELLAYEAGYRIQPTQDLAFDFATFYNDYSSLVTRERATPFVSVVGGVPRLIVPVVADNRAKGSAQGIEISSNWSITPSWSLAGSYSLFTLDITMQNSTDSTTESIEDRSPRHQFNIRSRLDLPHNVYVDNYLFYVDDIDSIEDYIRFDTRIAWSPLSGIELSILGTNLLSDEHQEFPTGLYSSAAEIERSVFGQAKFNF